MNIHLLIRIVEFLDEAILLTPSKKDRKEMVLANNKLRKILQKNGVFIGTVVE